MFELNDKVKVKLHEPVGNPTTETANRYLRDFVDRQGWIVGRWYVAGRGWHYRAAFANESRVGQRVVGIFFDYELEAIND